MQSAAGAFRGTGIEPCAGLCERLALQAAAVGLVAECKEAVLRRMVFPRPQAAAVEQTATWRATAGDGSMTVTPRPATIRSKSGIRKG